MEHLLKYNEYFNLNESSTFDSDIKIWFDEISKNPSVWLHTDMINIIKGKPIKKNLSLLIKSIQAESNKPGKNELLSFLKNAEMEKYQSEFYNIEGKDSLIEEIFNLIKQAIEY